MQFLLVGLLMYAQAADSRVSGDQFVRLIRELQDPIKDLSFDYEGRSDTVGPASVPEEEDTGQGKYQGTYLYRKDGATFLDIYHRREGPAVSLRRTKYALLGNELQELVHVPDAGLSPLPRTKPDFGGFSLTGTVSPQKFLYMWFFRTLDDPMSRDYTFEGWEQVDGHNCLRVKLNFFPSEGEWVGPVPTIRLWIDLGRGGHPLKAESGIGGALAWRTHGIRLEQFSLPQGGQVWLPVGGQTDFYRTGFKSYDEPVLIETYHVVSDSVQINRALSDAFFRIDREPRLGELNELQRWREEFRRAEAEQRETRSRSDPEGVKAYLDAQLAEADRQERMLEASSPARRRWGPVHLFQIGLVAAGTAVIVTALVLRRRG